MESIPILLTHLDGSTEQIDVVAWEFLFSERVLIVHYEEEPRRQYLNFDHFLAFRVNPPPPQPNDEEE